jgi:3-oxoacyl-(acyl-carrier-protein) synthase
MGVELLASGQADRCIIAGAEEADWVLAEAYRKWRLAAPQVRIGSNRGTLIADGAAAIVLSREGSCQLQSVSSGVPFFRQSEAGASLAAALGQLPRAVKPALVISSANGTFVDSAERSAVEARYGHVPTIFPKVSLGDPFGASALMQIICAVQSVRRKPEDSVLVPVIGLNQQAAAAIVSGSGRTS